MSIAPNFLTERNLIKKGYKIVAGVDEAGRGALAGPVVAASVIIPSIETAKEFVEIGIKDSKLLTERKREILYEIIIKKCYNWSVCAISEKIIDKINIFESSKLAMSNAVKSLCKKPDFILVDGITEIESQGIFQMAVPSADKHILSVSAASIMAKVARDRILRNLDKKYPGYGFAIHKGYCTKAHLKLIKKNGICNIYRKSFNPIKKLLLKSKK